LAAASPARTHPWDLLFGPWSVGVGLAVVVGAVIGALWLDPGTLGVDVCWFRRATGLPCPGCGLSRSVVALARGDLAASLAFHPFGPLVLAWAMAAAGSLLLRDAARRRLRAALERAAPAFDRGYRLTVAVFITFGVLRLAGAALGLWAGP
jgi:Protein of unknown function (DUF2752)